jgi:catechol 2,3-dioxygenase-like lactoylglutathione lyase family enzyme
MAMLGHLTHVTVYVSDQDAAKAFYTETLGFALVEDNTSIPGMRWLSIQPPGGQAQIVLFKAGPGPKGGEAKAGGWTGMVLHCPDLDATYAELKAKGVEFTAEPSDVPWGRHTNLRDPDGNEFNVVQPNL